MRKLGGLLGLVALASLMPATAEGKLSKPERRAVDIRSVTGASTSTAMLAEIRFAGNLGDVLGRGALRKAQVKVELLTASGQTTVITDRGAARRQRQSRSGTVGAFELIRGRRSLLLLAEGFSEPVRQVVVSTGTGAAISAQDQSVIFDRSSTEIQWINFEEARRLERERIHKEIGETQFQIQIYEDSLEDLVKRVDRYQERLNEAENAAESKQALEDLNYAKDVLQRVTDQLRELRMKLSVLRRWLEIVNGIKIIVVIPLS
jgi:hypothetical protein